MKWAAHLPFRQAAPLLKGVLPLDEAISFSVTRDPTHAVGKALDAEIESEFALQPPASASESLR